MKVYLAGPLFSISERTHNLRLARELTRLGYEVLLPQVEALKYLPDLLVICKDCREKAMTSDVVVANIDGSDADSGTALEVGLALASSYRPVVICVRTDFRTSLKGEVGINGMLQLVDKLIYKPSFVTTLKGVKTSMKSLLWKFIRLLGALLRRVRRRVTVLEDSMDINNMRQNHPELVVRDLSHLVPASFIRNVLKWRGVNKWLRVRRLLIQLKSQWREDIKLLEKQKTEAKARGDYCTYHKLLGRVEAMIDCRQQVRALCHSPRDIDFPDSPRDFGVKCDLPASFPKRPHKRWFWKYEGQKETL